MSAPIFPPMPSHLGPPSILDMPKGKVVVARTYEDGIADAELAFRACIAKGVAFAEETEHAATDRGTRHHAEGMLDALNVLQESLETGSWRATETGSVEGSK